MRSAAERHRAAVCGKCAVGAGRSRQLSPRGRWGAGHVPPGVGPCHFMAARHGTIALRAGVHFFGGGRGLRGGGGAGGCSVSPPTGGGRRWDLRPAWPKKPGGVPWPRGPLRGRTSDSPGGTPLDGMVWYGMVWYVVVVVVVVVVKAPSTCRREKLPDTLSLGRAQGSRRPASRWPGVCRQRPRRGGGRRGVQRGGGARGGGWGHLWKSPWSPPPSRGGRVTRPVRSGCGGGGGWGGDLGVGKARPGPRTFRALPEHPAEVAVPRVRPWRGRGRWPVLLAFYGGEGRPGSCCLPAPSHLCWSCGVAASSPVVRARARVGHGGGRAQGREHKSTNIGLQLLACRVWFSFCPLVPVPVSCLREAARHSRRGVEARAGRMGSGGRPGRTRRHAGAGPVAVAGGCGRSSRRSAVALSAPNSRVGGRAGGGRVRKGIGVPGAGPSAGRGTCGEQVALPGG